MLKVQLAGAGECFSYLSLTPPGEAGSAIDEEITDPLRNRRPCNNANCDSSPTAPGKWILHLELDLPTDASFFVVAVEVPNEKH